MSETGMTRVEQGLVEELAEEEKKLDERYGEYEQIRARYQVAARKYGAVRDVVIETLGYDPYSVDDFPWPDSRGDRFANGTKIGEFRYVYMKPGETVVAVLRDAEEPMELADVREALKLGHSTLTLRAVNAALMNTSGVVKTKIGDDVSYTYEPSDEPIRKWTA